MSRAPMLMLGLQRVAPSGRYQRPLVWILTFFVYASYHLSRKPITVVKNALHSNCTIPSSSAHVGNETQVNMSNITDTSCEYSWKPFDNGHPYEDYFGALDVTYLAGYAIGMFISGHVAERMNLRYFLSGGMLLSALMTVAFGLGHTWNIHSLAYFLVVQILCGIVQSTGWPGVVACMGNWFGKGRRGLIMGIWNAHTSLGNILGGLIASAFLTTYWKSHGYWFWSFFYPALIIFIMSILVFLFLVPHPEDVGQPSPNQADTPDSNDDENAPLINDGMKAVYGTGEPSVNSQDDDETVADLTRQHSPPAVTSEERQHAVSFLGALRVPGVVEFSLCLFFAKLVSYTFLYWLPQYIKQEMSLHVHMDDPDARAGDLATIMDVGGIFGAIAAGFIADMTNSSAITCAIMLVGSIPAMILYRIYGALSNANAVGFLLLAGFMVNGPYCLITTSVSADLGTHRSLASSARALATVTAIIDGTGSIGAALGPGLTAIIEGLSYKLSYKMNIVFGMLIASNVLALLLLSRLIYKEVQAINQRRVRKVMVAQ